MTNRPPEFPSNGTLRQIYELQTKMLLSGAVVDPLLCCWISIALLMMMALAQLCPKTFKPLLSEGVFLLCVKLGSASELQIYLPG